MTTSANPLTQDVVLSIALFFAGGKGPRHADIKLAFDRAGCGDLDPGGYPDHSKEARVKTALGRAVSDPRGPGLLDALLAELRNAGCFKAGDEDQAEIIHRARQSFNRAGYRLSPDGYLSHAGTIDMATGGRPALDEQIVRLKRSSDDPALALGTAKDLLEAVCKHALEELAQPPRSGADFSELWYLARDRLNIRPEQVAESGPASQQVRKILGAGTVIGEQVNELRNLQGTGHGRTLPTGISAEVAQLVVREAVSVAEFMLTTLDRALRGR